MHNPCEANREPMGNLIGLRYLFECKQFLHICDLNVKFSYVFEHLVLSCWCGFEKVVRTLGCGRHRLLRARI